MNIVANYKNISKKDENQVSPMNIIVKKDNTPKFHFHLLAEVTGCIINI